MFLENTFLVQIHVHLSEIDAKYSLVMLSKKEELFSSYMYKLNAITFYKESNS